MREESNIFLPNTQMQDMMQSIYLVYQIYLTKINIITSEFFSINIILEPF